MWIIIVAYLTVGLVYTECAEQCLAHGKCSAVIMIQVFASMRKTFGKSFRPQHWSRTPKFTPNQYIKPSESHAPMSVVSGRAGVRSASRIFGFQCRVLYLAGIQKWWLVDQ